MKMKSLTLPQSQWRSYRKFRLSLQRIKKGTVTFGRLHLSSSKSEADLRRVIRLLVKPREQSSVDINLHPVCHRELARHSAMILQQMLFLILINQWYYTLHHLIMHHNGCSLAALTRTLVIKVNCICLILESGPQQHATFAGLLTEILRHL